MQQLPCMYQCSCLVPDRQTANHLLRGGGGMVNTMVTSGVQIRGLTSHLVCCIIYVAGTCIYQGFRLKLCSFHEVCPGREVLAMLSSTSSVHLLD